MGTQGDDKVSNGGEGWEKKLLKSGGVLGRGKKRGMWEKGCDNAKGNRRIERARCGEPIVELMSYNR